MLFGRNSVTCAPLRGCSIAAVTVLLGFGVAEAQDPPEVSAADYARAEQFLPWNFAGLVRNISVAPNWIDGSDRFWYRRQSSQGHQFVVVDPARNRREPAFDHDRLASVLSAATENTFGTEQTYGPEGLPFAQFDFVDQGRGIEFDLQDERWACALAGCGKSRVMDDSIASRKFLS